MSTKEERMKILAMIADGKVSAADGAKRMAAGGGATADVTPPEPEKIKIKIKAEAGAPEWVDEPPRAKEEAATAAADSKSPRWLAIKVMDMQSGKRKVNVRIPLRFLKFGLKIGKGFAPEIQDLEWEEVQEALMGAEEGMLIDVEDGHDGQQVQIRVE